MRTLKVIRRFNTRAFRGKSTGEVFCRQMYGLRICINNATIGVWAVLVALYHANLAVVIGVER
jgi:hypothetical protein